MRSFVERWSKRPSSPVCGRSWCSTRCEPCHARKFLPERLREICLRRLAVCRSREGQTISQPYIVAFMTEALALNGGERVLEIGTGSGYAAASCLRSPATFNTVERIVSSPRSLLPCWLISLRQRACPARDGRGLPDHRPTMASSSPPAAPKFPNPEGAAQARRPAGHLRLERDQKVQELVRITRISEREFRSEDLADVRFVPLIGHEGWEGPEVGQKQRRPLHRAKGAPEKSPAQLIADACEPISSIETAQLGPLLLRPNWRCPGCVIRRGFSRHFSNSIACATEHHARTDRQERFPLGRHRGRLAGRRACRSLRSAHRIFAIRVDRFWHASRRGCGATTSVRAFVDWLREHNSPLKPAQRVAFHGLDLYSLYDSIRAVLKYLDEVDPSTSQVARARYGCLTPWQSDPATYGHAASTRAYRSCESESPCTEEPPATTHDIRRARRRAFHGCGAECAAHYQCGALLSHHVLRLARIMEPARTAICSRRSRTLLSFYGTDSKIIVWAHNSHIGDAAATRCILAASLTSPPLPQGVWRPFVFHRIWNIRRYCCGRLGLDSQWRSRPCCPRFRRAMNTSATRPPFHRFLLNLRTTAPSAVLEDSAQTAPGARHRRHLPAGYRAREPLFQAVLPEQFDEYIWFDRTTAVAPL